MFSGMRVAVIGGGWYGCHMAATLIESGAEVRIFERDSDLFTGASAVNQNRLHMGFHYPRSFTTRKQIISGYSEFQSVYPSLVSSIRKNIYAVAERESLIDFTTYVHIMEGSGIPFERTELSRAQYRNIEGAILCDEQLVHTNQARVYFRELLKDHLYLSTEVTQVEDVGNGVYVNGEPFDYVLNCTWCTDWCEGEVDVYFEPTIMLFYKGQIRDFALTLMDGDFFSIYPFENDIYTLTSVPHTPLGQVGKFADATRRIQSLTAAEIAVIRDKMETLTRHYYPQFNSIFEYAGHAVSVKTKIANNTAARTCMILPKGRMITIFAGKIDTVFTAERAVKKILAGEGSQLEIAPRARRGAAAAIEAAAPIAASSR
jgi:hypothetical protein